ncbi:MAG: hypothetical protein AAGL69_00480 [Pseudomonadota bacterium]
MFRMIAVVLLSIPLSGCWLLLLDSDDSGGYSTEEQFGQTGPINFDAITPSPDELVPSRDGIDSLELRDQLAHEDGASLSESKVGNVSPGSSAVSANMAP